MDEYPKMLYRTGTAIEHDGRSLDTLIVDDAEAEKLAAAEGWAALGDPVKRRARKAAD